MSKRFKCGPTVQRTSNYITLALWRRQVGKNCRNKTLRIIDEHDSRKTKTNVCVCCVRACAWVAWHWITRSVCVCVCATDLSRLHSIALVGFIRRKHHQTWERKHLTNNEFAFGCISHPDVGSTPVCVRNSLLSLSSLARMPNAIGTNTNIKYHKKRESTTISNRTMHTPHTMRPTKRCEYHFLGYRRS